MFWNIYFALVLLMLTFGCGTAPIRPGAPQTRLVTENNVSMRLEFPQTNHLGVNAKLGIAVTNASKYIMAFWPARFEVKVCTDHGLLVPVMMSNDVSFLSSENTGSTAEDETTVGKRLILLRPGQTFALKVNLQESYRFYPGRFRIEVSGSFYLRPSHDYSHETEYHLRSDPLEVEFKN